ncbi:hypothetical protein SEMRO_3535_G349040.1 [Seminavis robusta]|uniref:Uncharacterized protein n=1 Tax=Seminavis robusta TaxID=568900 RepID=A0A9N8F219_9STRA|nr:hypothetical protein SEMRO_3535_G349040.1 [Seminavis robusta]|eukprot:Sro3535_g349040.1 n/a (232) ;mRNA; r:1350-2045
MNNPPPEEDANQRDGHLMNDEDHVQEREEEIDRRGPYIVCREIPLGWNIDVDQEDLLDEDNLKIHNLCGVMHPRLIQFCSLYRKVEFDVEDFKDCDFYDIMAKEECKSMVLKPLVDWISETSIHMKHNIQGYYGIKYLKLPNEDIPGERGGIEDGWNVKLSNDVIAKIKTIGTYIRSMKDVTDKIEGALELCEIRRGGASFVKTGCLLGYMDAQVHVDHLPQEFCQDTSAF